MTVQTGRVPMLDDNGRFPDRYAPPAVAQAVIDAAAARDAASGSAAAAADSAAAAAAAPANDTNVAAQVTGGPETVAALNATYAPSDIVARQQVTAELGPRRLARWKLALANRETAQAGMLWLGDSNTERQGATAYEKGWISLLPKFLREKYPTSGLGSRGGVGYISPASTGSTSFPWPITSPAGTTESGFITAGVKWQNRQIKVGESWTFNITGTSIDFMYLQGASGDISVTVDGGVPTVYTTSGSGGNKDGKKRRITLGASGAHTVTVAHSATGAFPTSAVYFTGIVVYDGDETRGIIAHEAGRYGWNTGTGTSGWTKGTPDPVTQFRASHAALSPALIGITLGTNDISSGITAAQYKANLQNLIALEREAFTAIAAPIPDFLIHMMPARITYDAQWPAYVTAATEIAAADPAVAVFDQTQLFANPTTLANGMWVGDGVHLSDKGHRAVAAHLAAAL